MATLVNGNLVLSLVLVNSRTKVVHGHDSDWNPMCGTKSKLALGDAEDYPTLEGWKTCLGCVRVAKKEKRIRRNALTPTPTEEED